MERTVVWKVIADFATISRSAAQARRELDRLERKERQYAATRAETANSQVTSNRKVVESNRQLSTSMSRVLDQAKELHQVQRLIGDATIRNSKVTDTFSTSLGKSSDGLKKTAANTSKFHQELDLANKAISRTNAGLVSMSEHSGEMFQKIADEAQNARRQIGHLRDDTNSAAQSSLAASLKTISANAKSAESAQKNASATHDAAAAFRRAGTEANQMAQDVDGLSASVGRATSSTDKHNESVRKTGDSHRRTGVEVRNLTNLMSRFNRMLSAMNPSGIGAITSAFARLRATTGQNTVAMSAFSSAMDNFKGDYMAALIVRLSNGLMQMGSMALLAGDALAVLSSGLAAVGTGLMGMLGSLGPVVGLLGTLPGFALAAAGALGTTMGSLKGVFGALKAYNKEQDSTAKTGQTAAQRQLANNRKLRQSEEALDKTRRTSARAIRDAERGLRDARERSARAQVDAARSIEAAEKSLVQSKRNVVRAEQQLVKAQQDVNDARQDAIKTLRDLQNAVKRYALQEEGASLSLEEARKRLTEVMNDPGSTDLQRRGANLAVREAEERLREVREASDENDKKLEEAQRKGIEGSDQVVAAVESERQAQESLVDARENVAEAEFNLARTREDAARSIRDSTEAVTRAEEQLTEAKLNGAEATQRAAEAMEAAALSANTAAGATDAYAEAMAKLSPEAQAVVRQLIDMKDSVDELRLAAERGVMPGFLTFLQEVDKLFPRFIQFAGEAGLVMGNFFADLGRMSTTPEAMEGWDKVLTNAVDVMKDWSAGLLNVSSVIGDIAQAAVTSGLNEWLGDIVVGWTEAWKAWTSGEEGAKNLNEFFKSAMESATIFGNVIAGLSGFFFNTGKAGKEAGNEIWGSFISSLDEYNKWAKSAEGSNRIKELAEAAVPVLQELGNLIIAIAKGMGKLSEKGGGEFLKQLREQLGPAIMGILTQLKDTNVIGNFVAAISSIGKSIVESGLLEQLGNFANNVFKLAKEAIPALTPVFKVLIAGVELVVKAFTGLFWLMNNDNPFAKIGGWVLFSAVAVPLIIAGVGKLLKRFRDFFRSIRAGYKDLNQGVKEFVKSLLGMRSVDLSSGLEEDTRKVIRLISRIADSYDTLIARMDAAAAGARRAAGGRLDAPNPQTARSVQRARRPDVNAKTSLTQDALTGTAVTPAALSAANADGRKIGISYSRGVQEGLTRISVASYAAGQKAGDNFSDGLKNGARKGEKDAEAAGEDLAESVEKGTKDGMESHSPSRVAIRLGKVFGDSLSDGVRSERRNAHDAGEDIAEEVEKGANKGLKGFAQRIGPRFKNILGGVVKIGGAALAAGGAAVVGFSVSAMQASTELADHLRKTNQVYGEYTGEVERWAGAAANGLGLNKTEAVQLMNNFGQLFTTMGMGQPQAAQLAQEMSTLAAGLAAANPGVEVTDAYEALRAAFEGDYTALAQLNPALSESAVFQQALQMTGKRTTDELTEQEKQAALLELAQGKLGDATDILGEKQKSMGGRIEEAKNKWHDFKLAVGEKLENKLADLAKDIEVPGTAMYNLSESMKKLMTQENIDTFVSTIVTLSEALVELGAATVHVMGLLDAAPKKTATNKEFDKAYKKEIADQKKKNLSDDSEIKNLKFNGSVYTDKAGAAEVERVAKKYGLTSADLDSRRGFRPPSVDVYKEIIAEEKARQDILKSKGVSVDQWNAQQKDRASSSTHADMYLDASGMTTTPTRDEMAEEGRTKGSDFAAGLNEGIATGMAEGAVTGPWTRFIQWFKDLFGIKSPSTLFAGFGKDIVDGLINGIRDTINGIGTTITNFFTNNIINPVKNFLGIQSPSTVFSGFGGDVVQGFINGVLEFADRAKTTITTWFNDNILTPVKEFLGIQSPSTVFSGFGGDVVQGFIGGIVSFAENAKNFIRKWFDDNIVKPVKEFLQIQSPSTLFNTFGGEVIQGFIDGITNMAQQAKTFIQNWFKDNIVTPVQNYFQIQSPSRLFLTFGTDVVQGFINGIVNMVTPAGTAVTNLVNEIVTRFEALAGRVRGPIQELIDTVYNNGLRKMWNDIAAHVDLPTLPPVTFAGGGAVPAARSAGGGRSQIGGAYDVGGWTGPGDRLQPAGIVHADEYVIRKSSRRAFERDNPGLLDHINRKGTMRGYSEGGLVKGTPGPSSHAAAAVAGDAKPMESGKWYPSGAFSGYYPSFFLGGVAPVPGGRVTNPHPIPYKGTPARWAGDLAMPMGTPVSAWKAGTVASTRRQATSYGWHIFINHGDGSNTLYAHLSQIGVTPGQAVAAGQRIGAVGSTGNSKGPHLHFEVRGGTAPLRGGIGAAIGDAVDAVAAPVIDLATQVADAVTAPLRALREKHGDSPWTRMLFAMPEKLAAGARRVLEEKMRASAMFFGSDDGSTPSAAAMIAMGAAGAAAGVSGSLASAGAVTPNTRRKGEQILASARAAGHAVSTVLGFDPNPGNTEHHSRRALDFMVRNRAAGDFISNFTWGNRGRYGVQHIIWWQRIISAARAREGWRPMANRGSPTQNHMDHPHILFSPSDLPGFARGGSVGGWTGPGHMMKPAGVVHADEFVVRKSSRRKFERDNPGALDHINRTGKLPGYHGGGRVKTGGADGAWWEKDTSGRTNKWLGALRNYLGLDEWWLGWDDNFDNAIRNYNGQTAAHVYGPWRGIIDAMRRLPLAEFTSTQNVASKIGVHPDSIFRMMDTNWAHFTRDLGDPQKVERLQPSYQRFRDFHKESVEELQGVMGVEVTGYWTEQMRQMVVHLKHHAFGTAHPDNSPVGEGWSTTGAWGDAFNELYRSIQINNEWDKILDHFYQLGYDSLVRHLNEKGTAEGMELARDLYKIPLHAEHANAWYQTYYEREDAIKDQNSELNRLRRLTSYIRRHDNVGLQGLASELQLSMDTTAMLFRKAQEKEMLAGIGSSKISRLDKDIIEFDKLFRFALGGLVPGQGNLDSVFALLTPGEYVLTKDQTKSLFAAQRVFANYSGPAMGASGNIDMAMARSGAKFTTNNIENNITNTIVSPDPLLAGTTLQKHMSKFRDQGLFGLDDD